MSLLAIDFGGTRTRAALFSDDMVLIQRNEALSQVNQPAAQVIERLIETARSIVLPGETVRSIGISAPGPLDAEQGIIFHARTLPDWVNVPMVSIVRDAFGGVPVFMHNDANLAALAEYHCGAARNADPAIYLTISTGIGGGAIINGKLFTGSRGLAIEPGHMRFVDPQGRVLRLEELASGTGIARLANEKLAMSEQPTALRALGIVDGEAVGNAALAGDSFALEIVETAATWLGLGLVNLIHLYNPQVIVLGGSVAQLGDLLLTPLKEVIERELLDPRFNSPDLIRLAELGDNVCLYGAALYASSHLASRI